MRAVKRALVAGSVVAWVIVAFYPRDRISAGPRNVAPAESLVFSDNARVVNGSGELAIPTDVEIVGEYLVVVDRHSEQPIHVLRRASGELLRSLGRAGDGPGEYRGLRSIIPAPDSRAAFWAYDMANSRLTFIDLADDTSLERPWEARLLTLDTNARVTGVEFSRDESIIAAGFFAEGRLGLFTRDGRMIRAVGALPANPHEAPANVLQHAYMGTLKARPDGSRLAIGLRHASSIEIRDPSGALLARTELPGDESFEPLFEVADTDRGPMMQSDDTLRFGYIDVSVTSDRIYGLYSGRTRAGNPGVANFGRQVHVFDWSGTLLEVIELEQDLIAIAVEADGRTLFGVRHDPAPAVLSWSLETDVRLASR